MIAIAIIDLRGRSEARVPAPLPVVSCAASSCGQLRQCWHAAESGQTGSGSSRQSRSPESHQSLQPCSSEVGGELHGQGFVTCISHGTYNVTVGYHITIIAAATPSRRPLDVGHCQI